LRFRKLVVDGLDSETKDNQIESALSACHPPDDRL